MKNRRIQIAVYTLIIMVSWLIVGLGNASRAGEECRLLRTVIRNQENNHFLDAEAVAEIVRDIQGAEVKGQKMGDLKVADIERGLESNPYVRSAEAYKRPDGVLAVELELRKPLARVIPYGEKGFYLDQELRKVDISPRYTANTVLVRGAFKEPLEPREALVNPVLGELGPLLHFVDEDPFLRSQISEIVIAENGELILFPEVGDVIIRFGKPGNYEAKFRKLQLFYERVLKKVGWEKYKQVDLRFRDQIVAS